MINVNFRVTGMYLGASDNISPKNKERFLTVEVKENPTVLDIMKAVSKKASFGLIPNVEFFVFSPSTPSVNDSINAIYVKYKNDLNKNLKAGLYVLQDNFQTNPITTFQYYIYDENFKQLNNNNRSKTFGDHPDEEIKDQYTVIIRQVSILTGDRKSTRLNSSHVD